MFKLLEQLKKTLLSMSGLLKQLFPSPAYDTDPAELPMNKEIAPKERIIEVANAAIGKDLRTGVVSKDLACVEHLIQVLKPVVVIPEMYHTAQLHKYLRGSKNWRGTLALDAGNVILSVTGTGNGTIRGHTGILINQGLIVSNDSETGKWSLNYSVGTWVKRFRNQGGMSIYVFEAV